MGTAHDGGERDLAPVISLFDRRPAGPAEQSDPAGSDRFPAESAHPAVRARRVRGGAAAGERGEVDGAAARNSGDRPAGPADGLTAEQSGPADTGGEREDPRDGTRAQGRPTESGQTPARAVLRPLRDTADAAAGAANGTADAAQPPDRRWHTTWQDDPAADDAHESVPGEPGDGREERDGAQAAEDALVRALRRRSLSVSEARTRLIREDVPAESVEEIIARLGRIGALDDSALAEQLVHIAVNRKRQGRRAVAQTLSARGIARDAIESALAELPDDDAERALEYARGKASRLVRYDEDTALRRLIGQLSRRGFGGGVAMTAARTALEEARGSGGGGVRFR